MKYQNKIVLTTERFIELCHFFETGSYDKFKEDAERYFSTCKSVDDITIFNRLANGEKILGYRNAKKFYRRNIELFSIMTDVSIFLLEQCDVDYKFSENNSYNSLNKYILKNKNNIKQINELLDKCKELDFKNIIFDENLNFKKEEYSIEIDNYSELRSGKLYYLENMYALVNYRDNKIKYKTKESNYKIFMKVSYPLKDSIFQEQNIYLNSLVFDVKKLPNSLNPKEIFNEILKLKEKQKENCQKLKNNIDLEISINDLEIQYGKTLRMVESLTTVESKKDLLEVLQEIKKNINVLEVIKNEYTDEIVYNNPDITKAKISEELHSYYKKRDKEKHK